MRRFNNIICVVSNESQADPAWTRALALADHNQSQLTIVSVLEKFPAGGYLPKLELTTDTLQQAMVAERQQKLSELIKSNSARIAIEAKVLQGTEYFEIIREVLRNKHDLVIKSVDSDLEFSERLFGSDDMHLLRKCPCPVWLLKPGEPKQYRRIIAAVDLDDNYGDSKLAESQALNQQALEMASSLALSEFAELHVVYAWEALGENFLRYGRANLSDESVDAYVDAEFRRHKQYLHDAMDALAAKLGMDTSSYVTPKSKLLKGNPRQVIPQYARVIDADLVVMGTVARTGISGFIIGNTAESILNQLDCSVLAIKPPGFVSPVQLKQ